MEKTFYDIHMHALNLSHPNFLAFVRRLGIPPKSTLMLRILGIASAIVPSLLLSLIERGMLKAENLLAVMENDIGSFFLLMEKDLTGDYPKKGAGSHLLENGQLHVGGNTYSKIVLTPLMMDFGYKGIKGNASIHYSQLAQKPIVEQVMDVFNGIKKYRNEKGDRIFEIYPFLGLNTGNYDMYPNENGDGLKKLLEKHFDGYAGSRQALNGKSGNFGGDIKLLGSNDFAGIKLYPPLGFDPWPKDKGEFEKVDFLYKYCCERNIPITAHSSEDGFVAVPKGKQTDYTSISKWEHVLEKYPKLKLNLAHFPVGERKERERLEEIKRLVSAYDNVYVDFSCRAVNDKYYRSLKELLDRSPGELKEKLKRRILFGSDFAINLLSPVNSYNEYLEIFSRNASFSKEEKDDFCCTNPERFLFSKEDHK